MSKSRRSYTQITKAVYERPWAIQPAMLAVLAEIVHLRITGPSLTDEEIEARVAAARNGPRTGPARAQGVAVIPIYGVISPRMDLMTAMSGGTSVEGIRRAFREAQADPDIGAIVFDTDSPGGAVDGIFELADEIRAARGGKPIAAVANSVMASAAAAIGMAADEVVVTPSGQVGSIGIVAMRPDQSGADEQEGVTYNVITAGGNKDTYNPHVPLTDDGRDEIQGIVDDFYEMFVGAVTKSRGVTAKKVTQEWRASMFTARKAVAAGLADRVETLDATVRRMVVKANRTSPGPLAVLGAVDSADSIAALASGLDYSDRVALASALVADVAESTHKRLALRAEEGRDLSDANWDALSALAGAAGSLPAKPAPETAGDPDPTPPQANGDWRGRARLDVLEAATRGGYSLPLIEVPTS